MVRTKVILSLAFYFLFALLLVSCRSNRYFATPDYFTKQPGELILKNGEKIKGDISVNNLLGNSVMIHSYANKKKFTYTVPQVKTCRLDIGIMEPMMIGREVIGFYSQPVFMERLTPDSLSISLYEAYEKLTNPNLMGDVTVQPGGTEYNLEYYVHLPYDSANIVWQLSTAILTDHLRKGLDSLLGQCSGFLEKIRSDTAYNIYFSPQIDITEHFVAGRLVPAEKEKKVKKIIRVFGEYEKCRKK